MADPTSHSPEPSRRRRRRSRRERREKWALLLLLLAILVGAAVFAPGIIDLARKDERPHVYAVPRPAPTTRPLARPYYRFDFSMGPILELLEAALDLKPLDLRRPLRIPFATPLRPSSDEILLSEPVTYRPPTILADASPLPDLPSRQDDLRLPGYPGFSDPGGTVPNGEPDFDPELLDSDDEDDDDGNDGGIGTKPDDDDDDDDDDDQGGPPVPEPGGALLLAPVAFVVLRRTRS
jgi:hypothetical protein